MDIQEEIKKLHKKLKERNEKLIGQNSLKKATSIAPCTMDIVNRMRSLAGGVNCEF